MHSLLVGDPAHRLSTTVAPGVVAASAMPRAASGSAPGEGLHWAVQSSKGLKGENQPVRAVLRVCGRGRGGRGDRQWGQSR